MNLLSQKESVVIYYVPNTIVNSGNKIGRKYVSLMS